MSEDWEYDFNNPPKIPPPSLIPECTVGVQCDYCFNVARIPHIVVKHIGRSTWQMNFCDNLCEHLFYLQHLREAGL